MSLLTMCPVIIPPKAGLVESWTHTPHLVVINGEHDRWLELARRHGWDTHIDPERRNIGCPASWNIAFETARTLNLTHVAILSQSLVIAAGTAAFACLAARTADERGMITQFNFHCIVLSVGLWERLGGFDEALPIWADMDFVRRIYLGGELRPGWFPLARIVADDEHCAALQAGAVTADLYHRDPARYARKWGGPWMAERFLRPWDLSSCSPARGVASHGKL